MAPGNLCPFGVDPNAYAQHTVHHLASMGAINYNAPYRGVGISAMSYAPDLTPKRPIVPPLTVPLGGGGLVRSLAPQFAGVGVVSGRADGDVLSGMLQSMGAPASAGWVPIRAPQQPSAARPRFLPPPPPAKEKKPRQRPVTSEPPPIPMWSSFKDLLRVIQWVYEPRGPSNKSVVEMELMAAPGEEDKSWRLGQDRQRVLELKRLWERIKKKAEALQQNRLASGDADGRPLRERMEVAAVKLEEELVDDGSVKRIRASHSVVSKIAKLKD